MPLPVVPELPSGEEALPASANCQGSVRLGNLPGELKAKLARHAGPWLELDPEHNTVVVRHVQPEGCPAIAGVPCELLTILDTLPPEVRRNVPGGILMFRTQRGRLVRMLVEGAEVHVQWAFEDHDHGTPTSLEEALGALNPAEACVDGWARMPNAGDVYPRIEALIDIFEGLYPTGTIERSTVDDSTIRFKTVNVGPEELLGQLRELARPTESLEADLTVTSFAAGGVGTGFRLRIRDGRVEALKPTLFPED